MKINSETKIFCIVVVLFFTAMLLGTSWIRSGHDEAKKKELAAELKKTTEIERGVASFRYNESFQRWSKAIGPNIHVEDVRVIRGLVVVLWHRCGDNCEWRGRYPASKEGK